jgi:hypothetical protein
MPDIEIDVNQTEMEFIIEQHSIVNDCEIEVVSPVTTWNIEFSTMPGMNYVYTTGDLEGTGKADNPLRLSDSLVEKIDGKQDKLIPGPGIKIVDDTISVDNSYIYEQGVAASTWTINHNLGRNPTVVVIDTAGNVVEPAVQYVDLNTCIVSMNYAFKGTAYLN